MARINNEIHKQVFYRGRGIPERIYSTETTMSQINQWKHTVPTMGIRCNNNQHTPQKEIKYISEGNWYEAHNLHRSDREIPSHLKERA